MTSYTSIFAARQQKGGLNLTKKPLFFILLSFIFITQAGCDGMMNQNTIKADAMLSENVLELPINSRMATGIYVNEGISIYESKLNFINQVNIATEICGAENIKEYADYDSGTRIHIHLPINDQKADDYYLAINPGGGNKQRFIFSGMRAVVIYDANNSSTVLLPYHLISDTRITCSVKAELFAGAEYESCERIDELELSIEEGGYGLEKRLNEFYEFYCASGWYDVAKGDGNTFTIKRDGHTYTYTFLMHAERVFFTIS